MGLAVKQVGEPDSGNREFRFDERRWETGRWPLAPSYRAHLRLYHFYRRRQRSIAHASWMATVGGIGSGRSLHVGASSKCEHWRSVDLASLKRMGLLNPIVGGRIKAITWKRDDGSLDKLGIISSARGIQFVKRDDQGKLAGLFVAFTCTPTMFGGYRKWFACPGCLRPARILYGVNSLQCRRCRGLKYASQSEAPHWRVQRKALSIRRRVSASGDTLDGAFPPKPPKMRWSTYEHLRAVDAALQEQWLLCATGDLGRLHNRVKRRAHRDRVGRFDRPHLGRRHRKRDRGPARKRKQRP